MILRSWRTIWAIFKNEWGLWMRDRVTLVASITPALAVTLIGALGTVSVGQSPVALVTLDHGPKGQEMQQTFHQADVFRITDASPQQAQALLHSLQVLAVITIPANFTQRVEAHESSPVEVMVNNLNLDFTNDIRRAVPDVITQFYQEQGSANPIKLSLHEQDLHSRDVGLFEFGVPGRIILLILLNGLVIGGIATAREWETRTIKEMLLSPVARATIILGKVLAGFTEAMLLGTLVFFLSAALGWVRPEGIHWVTSLLIMALIALFSTGLGVAVGAALQRIEIVSYTVTLTTFYLDSLAGGLGVLAFEPSWLQTIAAYSPLTYGEHALRMALFYHSSDQLGRDVLILCLSAALALVLGVIALRRGIAQ